MNVVVVFFFFFLIYVVFVGRLGLLPEKKKERLARKWLQKAAVSLFDAVRCLLSFPLVDSRDGGFCLTPNCFILVLMMIFHDVLMSTCSVRQPGAVNYAAASKYSSRISWTHLFFFFFFQRSVATAKTIIPARCWNLFNRLSFYHKIATQSKPGLSEVFPNYSFFLLMHAGIG